MWTTIRDVRCSIMESLGGHAACQEMGIELSVLTDAASEAWRAVGCGRYEDADEAVRSAVIEHAHLALAPGWNADGQPSGGGIVRGCWRGVAFVADGDGDGLVSKLPLSREEARALVRDLRAEGHEADDAPDGDDPTVAWVWLTPAARKAAHEAVESRYTHAAGVYEQANRGGWKLVTWSRHRSARAAESAARRYRRRRGPATGGALSWSAWWGCLDGSDPVGVVRVGGSER